MARILVGIDGSERGARALEWAARRAEREGDELTLLAVADPAVARESGVEASALADACQRALGEALALLNERYPGVRAATSLVEGKIVEGIIGAAASHDMVVLGSHHGATVGEAVGGAKGLRVSVSTVAPTVVVPSDWDPASAGEGVVVGVGPDKVSERAVAFGVREALAAGQPLELVSAWGLPPVLTRPAEVLGGGLAPVGEQFQRDLDARAERLSAENPGLSVSGRAVEGSSPARTLVECSAGRSLLVLGTHSRSTLGRALFGSVTHGVLLDLKVPAVVVPQA